MNPEINPCLKMCFYQRMFRVQQRQTVQDYSMASSLPHRSCIISSNAFGLSCCRTKRALVSAVRRAGHGDRVMVKWTFSLPGSRFLFPCTNDKLYRTHTTPWSSQFLCCAWNASWNPPVSFHLFCASQFILWSKHLNLDVSNMFNLLPSTRFISLIVVFSFH